MNQMKVETTEHENERLWQLGYLHAPSVLAIQDMTGGLKSVLLDDGSYAPCPDEVRDLAKDDPVRIEMVAVLQKGPMSLAYKEAGLLLYGREPLADSVIGEATKSLMEMPRCGCPDFEIRAIEATGSGPWKGCHSVGDFHSAHVKFTNNPPSHLNGTFNSDRTIFQEALRRTQESYRKIGLLFHFSGEGVGNDFLPPSGATVQSNASFVNSSSGWIGLAIVGNNGMTCSSNAIWAQFLSSFDQSNSVESKVHSWHLLLAHEFGHNCGLGHTSGGIMNPSLNRGSDGEWIGDVAESWMKGRFGGQPVPIPGPGPGPDPPPPDDDKIDWAAIIAFIIKIILEILKKPKTTMATIAAAMKKDGGE